MKILTCNYQQSGIFRFKMGIYMGGNKTKTKAPMFYNGVKL